MYQRPCRVKITIRCGVISPTDKSIHKILSAVEPSISRHWSEAIEALRHGE